jgi:glycosyltransferase involved in cell wall biosynthesis
MKTLHIEMGRHRLGGTMQVYYLLRGLRDRGIPATLVCPRGSPLHEMAAAAGIDVRAMTYGGDLDLRFPFRLWRILREVRPDIVHIHSRRGADTLGLLTARLAGGSKIVLARRVDDPVKTGWLTQLRYVRLPDRVVTVSQGIARVLVAAGVPEAHIRQVYSAIEAGKYQSPLTRADARRRLDLPDTAPVLAVVAQLIPRKGHRFLLRAMPRLLSVHPDLTALFIGEGEHETALRAEAAQLGLGDRVRFLGYREDIADLLRASDILVHPATMEGFANVAMQAMAAGIPVVSSAVGGMPESVRHEISGLLVPPGDSDALAETLLRLLDDPAQCARLGQAGREIVEREFTTEAMVSGNIGVYTELLKS